MFGTFFKSAGNPFLFRTMVPHVNIFLESNDLASDTEVKKKKAVVEDVEVFVFQASG